MIKHKWYHKDIILFTSYSPIKQQAPQGACCFIYFLFFKFEAFLFVSVLFNLIIDKEDVKAEVEEL